MDFKALLDIADFIIYQLNFFENGIIRTGAPWRDLPVEFGPWKTVYNRYNRWVKLGYLDSIFEFVQKRWRQRMA